MFSECSINGRNRVRKEWPVLSMLFWPEWVPLEVWEIFTRLHDIACQETFEM
jgi:hypothetical protein